MRPTKQAHRILQTLTCILLIACLFPLPQAFAARKASSSQLRKKQSALNTKIRKVRSQLHAIKAREARTVDQLHRTESRVRISRGQLEMATLQYERKRIELQRAEVRLHRAEQEFSEAQGETSDRLVALYERGEQGYLELLFTATDFGEFLQRAQLARFMMDQDRDILDTLKSRREKMSMYRQQVKHKTSEVAAWRQQVALLHHRTVSEQWQVGRTLSSVRDTRDDMEAELAALERDSAEVTSMLRRLSTSSAGRRRFATRYIGNVGGLPIAGHIGSGFGYRYHPILHYRRLHTGVDIGAPMGTPIPTTGGGEVVFAGRRGGYGNCVIIDHGGGKATLYAHMSAILVSAGQVVRRGQVIGRVGSTGLSTGPHLHYEVRINGVPVNPF